MADPAPIGLPERLLDGSADAEAVAWAQRRRAVLEGNLASRCISAPEELELFALRQLGVEVAGG